LNNLLFISILVVCFWGVIFPLISEIFSGQKVTVGPPFYERATAPLFAGLLLLMAVAPLAVWRFSTAKTLGRLIWRPFAFSLVGVLLPIVYEITNWAAILGFWLSALVFSVALYDFLRGILARHRIYRESLPVALIHLTDRNRRRYGGYIVHLGVVLMVIGIIGIELFQTETQGTISQGEQIILGQYTISYESLAIFDTNDGRNIARAVVGVNKDNQFVGKLYPRRDYFYEPQQPITIPGVRSTWEDDLYIILVDWLPISSDGATFKVYHNPLVNWLWLGSFVFIFGVFVAAYPEKEMKAVKSYSSYTIGNAKV